MTAHLTEAFPPTFLTVGNADPLEAQSHALRTLLESRGVEVDALLYAPDHEPALEHEYQFDLELEDARIALKRLVEFLGRVTR